MSVENALLSVGSGLAGAALGDYYNKKNMERQQRYIQENMRLSDNLQRNYTHDQYNLMRSGLESAGFNPISMFHGAGSSQESLASTGPTGGTGGNPLQNLDLARVLNETKLMKAQADKLDAETASIKAKTPTEIELNKTQTSLFNSQIEKIGSEIGLNSKETELKLSQITLTDQESDLVREKVKSIKNGEYITKILGTGPIDGNKLLKIASIIGGGSVMYVGKSLLTSILTKAKKIPYQKIVQFFDRSGNQTGAITENYVPSK